MKPTTPLSKHQSINFNKLVDDAFAANSSAVDFDKKRAVVNQLQRLCSYQKSTRKLKDQAETLVKHMLESGYPDTLSKVKERRRVKAFQQDAVAEHRQTTEPDDVATMVAMSDPNKLRDSIVSAKEKDLYYKEFSSKRFQILGPKRVANRDALADEIAELVCQQEEMEATQEELYGIKKEETQYAELRTLVAEKLSKIPMQDPVTGKAVYSSVSPDAPNVVSMTTQIHMFATELDENLDILKSIYIRVPLDAPLPSKDGKNHDLLVTEQIVEIIKKWRKLRSEAGFGNKNPRLSKKWLDAKEKALMLPEIIENLCKVVFSKPVRKGNSQSTVNAPEDYKQNHNQKSHPNTDILKDFLLELKDRCTPIEWSAIEKKAEEAAVAVLYS